MALNEGLSPAIVAVIAAGETPRAMQPNEAALHRFCAELLAPELPPLAN